MKHIPIYLWKEWREHRAALGVMLGTLALVAAMALTYFGWTAREAAGTFLWLPALCGIGALLTVGSDLFSRDTTARHAQFCERIPARLAPSYWSKLIFFTAVIAGSLLYGVFLCNAAIWLTGAQSYSLTPHALFWPGAGIAVALCFWVFSISSWSPSTVATVPATLLIAAGLLLPIWFISNEIYQDFNPSHLDSWWVLPSAIMGAAISGRICYGSIALRRKPKAMTALTSLGIASASLLPAYIPLGVDLIGWLNRPYDMGILVVGKESPHVFVQLSRDEFVQNRYALLLGGQRWEHSVLRLNIENLSKDVLGQGTLRRIPFQHYFWNGATDSERVGITRVISHEHRMQGFSCDVYDLNTGQRLAGDPMDGVFPTIRTGPHESRASIPNEPQVQASGFGTRSIADEYVRTSKHTVFQSPSGASLAVERTYGEQVRVLPYGFLKRIDDRWLFRSESSEYFAATDAIFRTEQVSALLSDGTVLIVTLDGELFVVDPRTGTRKPIRFLGDEPPRRGSHLQFMAYYSPDRIPLDIAQPLVVSIGGGDPPERDLAVIDFQALECQTYPAHRAEQLRISWSDGLEAFVIESSKRLVHVNLETGARRLLLDTADL